MVRILVRTCDAGMAANVGGEVDVQYKTFDCYLPELEAFVQEAIAWTYTSRSIIGAEILPEMNATSRPLTQP